MRRRSVQHDREIRVWNGGGLPQAGIADDHGRPDRDKRIDTLDSLLRYDQTIEDGTNVRLGGVCRRDNHPLKPAVGLISHGGKHMRADGPIRLADRDRQIE